MARSRAVAGRPEEDLMHRKRSSLLLSALLVLVLGAGAGINSSIHVADGEVREETLSALNGEISVGDGATVGECESVNGSVRVGRNARVESISAVNGMIEVGDGSIVERAIESVNGSVSLAHNSSASAVSTVNGRIRLSGAEVTDDLRTINGDIALLDGSTVGGDIVIEKRGNGSSRRDRPLRIELEGGSTVHGNVINEDPDVVVEIRLRDGSGISGRVENAEIID